MLFDTGEIYWLIVRKLHDPLYCPGVKHLLRYDNIAFISPRVGKFTVVQ